MSSALDRLKALTNKITSFEGSRKENKQKLQELYNRLNIQEKIPNFDDLFEYKAMNVTGLSLQAEDLGVIKENRYVQIICISYDKAAKGQKSKNSSLGYYGRSDSIDEALKNDVVKFILCWRFEKSFMTLEHYNDMISRVNNAAS
ncbi:hypothetical protein JHD50_02110 [Sulfurimonas sp. MAG313]|nr:hypothetical protein [Sulfurimonas sp. MAG313]MDF1880105.1 hypothetical protein [Sulfurimonas sp. MAG313]